MDWSRLRLLILDADGVLTDGKLWAACDPASPAAALDLNGKAFHVQDGRAIKQWQACGGLSAILSGRTSPGLEKRAAELGIRWCRTGVKAKVPAYDEILQAAGLTDADTIYVGDDLPDVGPMQRAAFSVAVANAVPAVKQRADHVTRHPGGDGAVAEVIERVLRKQGKWSTPGQPG